MSFGGPVNICFVLAYFLLSYISGMDSDTPFLIYICLGWSSFGFPSYWSAFFGTTGAAGENSTVLAGDKKCGFFIFVAIVDPESLGFLFPDIDKVDIGFSSFLL